MKKRRVSLLLLAIFLLTGGLYALAKSFQDRMVDFPIKTLTEEKLSSVLGAVVSVQQIKFGLLKQVSVSGLKIHSEAGEKDNFYLASVRAISFQYNLLSLLRRDFRNPHRVLLDSPQLFFRSFQLPEKLFQKKQLGKGADFLGRSFQLAIKGGRAEYPFFDNKYSIGLQDIDGVLTPEKHDTIKMQLSAHGAGVVRGNLLIKGELLPLEKSYDLNFHFKQGGEILLPGFLKLEKMEGTFRVRPNNISFSKVRFRLADVILEARGEIIDYESEKPEINLWFKPLLEKGNESAEIHLNFKKEEISGIVRYLGGNFPFNGLLFKEGSSVRISEMKVLEGYDFSADLDLKENSFELSLEKDPFRLNVHFAFDNWDVVSTVNLEHYKLQDIDVVAFAKLRLEPTEAFKKDKKWFFLGTLKTDYLIFDTEPVNDLQGTFQVNQFSIEDIKFHWGPRYLLTGNYSPLDPKKSTFALTLRSIDLGKLKRLFFYARPKDFGGIASGKIALTGDIRNPLIAGDIEVDNGIAGSFNYKAAYLKFSGYYPYLRLADSKIVRGKSQLYLKGDLNLKAQNVFQDLQVLSEDHIVLWRGVILSENLEDNLVMIGEGLKRKLTE